MSLDLAILQVKSLGRGHLLAQRVLGEDQRKAGVALLDFFNLGGECVLLIQGPQDLLMNLIKDSPSRELVRSQVIENVHADVLNALMSLDTAPIIQFSAIIESPFLGDILAIAQEAVTKGLKITELLIARRKGALSSLIVTAGDSGQEVSILQEMKEKLPAEALMTIISPVNEGYSDYFSVNPQN